MIVSVPPPVSIAIGTCPAHVRRLRPADLPGAKRAVLAMLPTLAARLDRRGARVEDVRFVHLDGDVQPARRCIAARRSVLVHVFLPRERRTPSLTGNPIYYLARTHAHWVVWFQAH